MSAVAAPTAVQASPSTTPVPIAAAREARQVEYVDSFASLCGMLGVLACFDFEGGQPLLGHPGVYRGDLRKSSDGRVRARVYRGPETAGGTSVRMDFAPEDGADHGTFAVTVDAFGEGDRMTVQWRQWFSKEMVAANGLSGGDIKRDIGGGGAKQLGINEIGDPAGCSFGEIVTNTYYWSGIASLYHGCGLWYSPKTKAPVGRADPSDFDMQPGGDNVCRYRYLGYSGEPPIDFIYPTNPVNLLEVPKLSAVADALRYHGCLGWVAEQWVTFRLEIDIAFCREPWGSKGMPESCRDLPGQLRYWMKLENEDKPWLVFDVQMPLRWKEGHSERYGRFLFLPYNTGEKPKADKPAAFTLYDDIVIARNLAPMPWVRD
ncbi:MAG: hypothetical protein H6983_24810 [Ectothiorhodospiraceae bacterium]|nr:hypothetical protein [Ectothiorhodospiraceae bacterium]